MTTQIQLLTPNHYNLAMTCHAHGWKYLAPFKWDEAKQCLRFATYIEEAPVDITVRQLKTKIFANIDCHIMLTSSMESEAQKMVTRVLGLNVDTTDMLNISEKVGPEYVAVLKQGAGRLLKSPTLWEDAAKTLFTTNCTWALTTQMCTAVCSETFSDPAPSGNYPFPGPEKIIHYSADQLKQLIPIGYRADYLIGLAELFVRDPSLQNIESSQLTHKEADKLVRGIKGFGNYATAHLLIMSGYYEAIPVDTVVVAYLKKHHRVRKPHSFINRTYKKWGKYKWWGFKLETIIRKHT